jgi:Na+/H+ antiporter NhaD/arsenite permease-like protein
MGKLSKYLYKDKVFMIAALCAIISMFFVVPNEKYVSYINFKVLIIMLTLMISVAGFYETHFFDFIATKLVIRFKSIKWISMIMIWTTFFLAMLLTNDAVLLTLVPFAIFILKHTEKEKYAVPIIILMTIAANMGSALTPMGDPQNIYLYAFYQIPFRDFITAMIPITFLGFILITVFNFQMIKNEKCELNITAPEIDFKKLGIYFLLLINALLSVLHIIPYWYTLAITLIIALLSCKHLFKRVDYTLLLTFFSFFIFTGNLSQMDWIKDAISGLLNSPLSVYLMGLGTSQIISNVPAAVLLSTFTDSKYYVALLQGVNVGSMGTIIGSLASLITFKYIIKDYPKEMKKYLVLYSLISILFIVIISAFILFII